MRVGLLLPNSGFIPRLAADIRRWVGAGLEDGGADGVELVVATSSFNENVAAVRASLQDLLIAQDVDAVVAPLNGGLAADVHDLAAGQLVPLIVLTMGEDVCAGMHRPPWTFVNSFGLWKSAWLTGWSAVRQYGSSVAVVAAAHEAGYGLGFAVSVGVEAAGGAVAATIPAPLSPDAASVARIGAFVAEVAPDAIVLLGSGRDGETLAPACGDVPCLTLPPHAWLPGAACPAAGLRAGPVFSTWDPASVAGAAFIQRFCAADGRPAHAYAVMAYETGLQLAAAARARAGQGGAQAPLRDALLAATVSGPRGLIAFDRQTQETVTVQHAITLAAAPDGRFHVRSSEPADVPPALPEHTRLALQNLDKQGWMNPYLVAS